METRPHVHHTTAELLQQDHYTPEELADLLEMDVNVILQAAFNKRLSATIIDHDVISITRAAALDWLNTRG